MDGGAGIVETKQRYRIIREGKKRIEGREEDWTGALLRNEGEVCA